MSKIQQVKLIALAIYVGFCGALVSAISFFIVNGLLS